MDRLLYSCGFRSVKASIFLTSWENNTINSSNNYRKVTLIFFNEHCPLQCKDIILIKHTTKFQIPDIRITVNKLASIKKYGRKETKKGKILAMAQDVWSFVMRCYGLFASPLSLDAVGYSSWIHDLSAFSAECQHYKNKQQDQLHKDFCATPLTQS